MKHLRDIKTLQALIVSISLMSSNVLADCTYELFTISAAKGTSINSFIDQITDECNYSILVTDSDAEKILDKKMNKTNIKNMTINEVFDFVLRENNLAYTLKNNILKISYLETKTYHIDYILSQRKGSGSTNITLSSSTNGDNLQGGTGMGSVGSSNTQGNSGDYHRL